MINDASVVIGGGNWGIKEADVLGYKLINSEYYARDIDFANSTADGTYTDSTGVVYRSPYNLFTYSEELDNILWLKNNITIVPNAGAAPNNTNTADSYASTTTVGPHPCYQSKVVTRNTYTYSVYVKKVNSRYVSLKGAGGMTVWTGVIFDLDTASVVSIQNNNVPGTTGAITPEGNGWYRISMTATSNFNDFGLQYASSPSNTFGNYGDLSIAGSGLVDYLLWGMQVVQGSSPMPYFYTTTRLNVPRIDYSNPDGTLSTTGKLLMEPQRTNSIRNSSMVGAVAGTPGTLPTNWGSSPFGLTQTIVGTGVENGLPYIDYRLSGTATFNTRLIFEQSTGIAAVNGQTWTESLYIKTISGTAPVLRASMVMRNSAGASVLAILSSDLAVTSTLRRFTYTAQLTEATTAYVVPELVALIISGQTYDFTIRVAAPQMELGAYATTWIPTTTAAVTRNADTASRTGVSSWIGQTEGTLFLDFNLRNNEGRSLVINDGTQQNRILFLINSNGTFAISQNTSGVLQYLITTVTAYSAGRHKVALSYVNNNYTLYIDGALAGTSNTGTVPACSQINIGNELGANQNSNPINQVMIFQTRLTNTQLQSLTTL